MHLTFTNDIYNKPSEDHGNCRSDVAHKIMKCNQISLSLGNGRANQIPTAVVIISILKKQLDWAPFLHLSLNEEKYKKHEQNMAMTMIRNILYFMDKRTAL